MRGIVTSPDATDVVSSSGDQLLDAVALLLASFDRHLVVHRNDDYSERSSGVVADLRKHTSELIAAYHRVVVIGTENHHMWVPMADS